jgi:hypothetical protein
LIFGKPFSSTAEPVAPTVGMVGVTPTGDGAEMTCVGAALTDGAGSGAGARPGRGSIGGVEKVSPGKGSVAGADATAGGGGAAAGGGMASVVLPGSGVEATTAWFDGPDGLTISASEGPTGFGLAAMAASV